MDKLFVNLVRTRMSVLVATEHSVESVFPLFNAETLAASKEFVKTVLKMKGRVVGAVPATKHIVVLSVNT